MIKRGWVGAADMGAVFLRSIQLEDGCFESFSSPTVFPFRSKITYLTTFGPALILNAISKHSNPDSEKVRHKLAAWLLAQKSPNWSFNYWSADAPEKTKLPYPDDLDDTFCALIALHAYDEKLIDATCLGSVVKLLIATESEVGGPYRTWLTAKDAPAVWLDIDLAVNSNIAHFLNLVAEPLPNLTTLMEQAILSGQLRSAYYPSIYQLAYYLSRAYRGTHASKLANILLEQQKDDWWQTPLQTALTISALTRLEQTEACHDAVKKLIGSQLSDGSWPAEAFCLDPAIGTQKYYSGSPALTTALAIEALTLYDNALSASSKPRQTQLNQNSNRTLHATIIAAAQQEIAQLPPPLNTHGKDVLSEMEQREDKTHEVTLLPHYFNNSLVKSLASSRGDILTQLGLANLYGWTAYTIYDNFLDNEGDPRQLSMANVAQRYSLRYFEKSLPKDKAFHDIVSQTFDAIDSANAWEIEYCRARATKTSVMLDTLPTFTDTLELSNRSYGHMLTPLAILVQTGVKLDAPAARSVTTALRHYLAARQLNDDMHDWEEDIRAGILTYVVVSILQGLSLKKGRYTFGLLIPKMKSHFWHHTIIDICKNVTRHTALARSNAAASGVLTKKNIIVDLVDAIDASVAETLSEQTKAKNFLKAYRGDTSKVD